MYRKEVRCERGHLLAYFILMDAKFPTGTTFYSNEDEQLQVGMLKHSKGKVVTAHKHEPVNAIAYQAQEVIILLRGKVRFDIYDVVEIQSEVLIEGDVAVLISGGHGLEVLEDCEMVEVKQGPITMGRGEKVFLRR